METVQKIDWFWAHRRNASLHHFSFLMDGLRHSGWLPAVNFSFDNQIVIGVPGKGCYIFYDKQQLSSQGTYKNIQASIDTNPNFVSDFKRRSDEIFGAIFFKCQRIDEENLELVSQEELAALYQEFIAAITIAPIITVQLWGIEACFDANYKIIRFLKKRLVQLDKEKEFENYKEILSANTGETVAFTEQKNFYQVAAALKKNPAAQYLIEKHIAKYEWVNTEYVSGGWTKKQWLDLFEKTLAAEITPEQKLHELKANFAAANKKRDEVIAELNPPQDVRHALDCLSELIAQRDWAKGYFTKALLSYNNLLDEIARRIGITREDILSYTYQEVDAYFKNGSTISATEIIDRQKNGFALLIKSGDSALVTGAEDIARCIEDEGIAEPFENVMQTAEFKGLPACRGVARGIAHVMEDASKIADFKEGEILITYMTTIEFIPAFRKASAIVTDEGGMSCHAAIISREFKLPCVVGTKIATRAIKTGDEIEVDATRGIVKIISSNNAA